MNWTLNKGDVMIDKIMKLSFGKIIILPIIVFIIAIQINKMHYNYLEKHADYTNSIYVITEEDNGTNKYYEINDKQNKRRINPFTCYDYVKYTIRFCHDHDGKENKNIFNDDTCIVSVDGNRFEKLENDKLKEIMVIIGNKFDSPIFETKVFKTNNHYYAFITLNTVMSIYSPDYLYYYDETKKELKYIYHHFYNEEITCIKEKDKLIFDED